MHVHLLHKPRRDYVLRGKYICIRYVMENDGGANSFIHTASSPRTEIEEGVVVEN